MVGGTGLLAHFQYHEDEFEPRAMGYQQKPAGSKLPTCSFQSQYCSWARAHKTPAL